MVFHLISEKNMKKIYIFFFLISSILLVNACRDSLGYDPNVVITSITTDTTGSSHVIPDTAYSVSNIQMVNFTELVSLHDDPSHPEHLNRRPIDWQCNLNKKEIFIDTNSTKPYISLDLSAVCSLPDPIPGSFRFDRIESFHLIFSSEIIEQTLYQLNKDSVHKEFVSIELKNFKNRQNPVYSYYNSDASQPKNIDAQLKIIEYNKNSGHLIFNLDIILRGEPFRLNYQTNNLSGILDIYFK